MENLKQKTGTSILFITHDLVWWQRFATTWWSCTAAGWWRKGDVRSIFASPSHPYTKGLLASIPKLGEDAEELESIPGNVPIQIHALRDVNSLPDVPAPLISAGGRTGYLTWEGGHMGRCWLCEKKGGDA